MKLWKTLIMFLAIGLIAASCGSNSDNDEDGENLILTNPSTFGGVGSVGNVSNYSNFVNEVAAGRFASVSNNRMTFIYELYSYEVEERDGWFGIDYTSTDIDFLRTFGRSINGSTVVHEYGPSTSDIVNRLTTIVNSAQASVQTGPASFRIQTFDGSIYEINLAIPIFGNPVFAIDNSTDQLYRIINMY